MVEQRYLALKDTPKFQQSVNSTNKQSYFMRNILLSYLSNAVLFTMIFLLLDSVYFAERDITALASFGLIIFLYLFIIGIYNSIVFLNSVYNNNIMAPLKSIPIKVNVNVPFASWFIYSSSSYIFVVLPSAVFFYILTGDYETIFLALLYAFLVMMLSFIISSVLFVYSGKKAKKHTSIRNVIRILMLFVFLGLFYLLLENPAYFGYVTAAISSLPYYVRIFAFPINTEYIVFYNYQLDLLYRVLELFLSILFLAIILLIYSKIRYKIYEILMTSEENQSSEKIFSSVKTSGMLRAFLAKDIKSTFRKTQNLSYIFLPVLFVIPFFFAVDTTSALDSGFFSLLYLVEFVSSFYAIFLLVVEGKGIEVLNSLPVSKREITLYKSIFGLIIFAVIAAAFVLVTAIISRQVSIYDFFEFFDGITLFYAIISINISRLLSKLPPGTSNLNYYSFGTYPMLFIFILSLAILGISMVFAVGLSFIVFRSLFYYVYMVLPVNIIILVFIMAKPKIFKITKML